MRIELVQGVHELPEAPLDDPLQTRGSVEMRPRPRGQVLSRGFPAEADPAEAAEAKEATELRRTERLRDKARSNNDTKNQH